MEVLALSKTNVRACAARAAEVLRAGGVIVYPTDTLYGLGADALSDAAVAKVYAIKGRDEGKPMHAIFANMVMVEEYAEVNDAALKLAAKFLPGALTLILGKKREVDSGIARGMDTIGVRIPHNEFCVELAKIFGKPYTATSANIAGEPPQRSVEKILEQLGPGAKGVALIVDNGAMLQRQPTTVVDVTSGAPVILREGAIAKEEILEA